MVHFNAGPMRWDPVCWGKFSLPHSAIRQTPSTAERYYSSGNERTAFDFMGRNGGTGYYLTPQDKFYYLIDLMNMNEDNRQVFMTMTYDYLEGELPPNWNSTKTVWLDVASCGTSEVQPPKQSGSFEIKSYPWKPNFEGRIIDSIGHLHDGGIAVQTMLGDGQMLCETRSAYTEKPEFRFAGVAMGPDKAAKEHISSMTSCLADLKTQDLWLRKNQSLQVIGKYDYVKWAGNSENGRQAEVSLCR